MNSARRTGLVRSIVSKSPPPSEIHGTGETDSKSSTILTSRQIADLVKLRRIEDVPQRQLEIALFPTFGVGDVELDPRLFLYL